MSSSNNHNGVLIQMNYTHFVLLSLSYPVLFSNVTHCSNLFLVVAAANGYIMQDGIWQNFHISFTLPETVGDVL